MKKRKIFTLEIHHSGDEEVKVTFSVKPKGH